LLFDNLHVDPWCRPDYGVELYFWRLPMTSFDSREKAFEDKFAHDAELQFKVSARRNKLLGIWAGKLMGLTAEESDAYAKAVIQADFEEAGDEDVIRKVLGDLSAKSLSSEADVRAALASCEVEARRQFMDVV
jgi:hypothetical protein